MSLLLPDGSFATVMNVSIWYVTLVKGSFDPQVENLHSRVTGGIS